MHPCTHPYSQVHTQTFYNTHHTKVQLGARNYKTKGYMEWNIEPWTEFALRMKCSAKCLETDTLWEMKQKSCPLDRWGVTPSGPWTG